MTTLRSCIGLIDDIEPRQVRGHVQMVQGLVITLKGLSAPAGTIVQFGDPAEQGSCWGQIVGFKDDLGIAMLLDEGVSIHPGMDVTISPTPPTVPVGDGVLGRVMDGLGRPIDARGGLGRHRRPIIGGGLRPLQRRIIDTPMATGIRAIDGLLTIGHGQRVGIFSGAGVGKSTLLASIAKGSTADVNVIGLVGERGREVREFIEHTIGDDGLARSVVVCATGDESPLMRVRAAEAATAIAEDFRSRGADVVLMIDSITRFAHAQRQIGLAAGEPPATRGYTPSVFSSLPGLLERAGGCEGEGSITGLYPVLVEADDMNEPVADAVRGILDGHVVLDRTLAERGHHPAINCLESVSRVSQMICDDGHNAARAAIQALMGAYRESEELIRIGAYAQGSDPMTDLAIELKPRLDEFLVQASDAPCEFAASCRGLLELATAATDRAAKMQQARPAGTVHAGQGGAG
ncbi:MAG: hypothetical protein CMJ32_11625 [Phycisphaerae bacterium]|nr:hypothetical protein [Phycisphaerae bacterium]